MDERDLMQKNLKEYGVKIQTKREELKELMSLSNGDPLSAITDVVVAQDHQTKMMEEAAQKMMKMNKQMLQLERLIQIANRNLNAMSKLQQEQASKMSGSMHMPAPAPAPAPAAVPEPDVAKKAEDHPHMRTTAFSRPRRRTTRAN